MIPIYIKKERIYMENTILFIEDKDFKTIIQS